MTSGEHMLKVSVDEISHIKSEHAYDLLNLLHYLRVISIVIWNGDEVVGMATKTSLSLSPEWLKARGGVPR